MIDPASPILQSIIVFGGFTLVLTYIAYRLARRDPPAGQPVTQLDPTHAYDTPDQWDGDSPLRLCGGCGTFNEPAYRFCRCCTGELRTAQTFPARSVTRLQKETENQP